MSGGDGAGAPGWPRGWEWAALALLAGTVLFNFLLAWVNANVVPISAGQFVAVQGVILAASLGLGLVARGPDLRVWLLLLWAMALWWLFLSLVRQSPNPKYLGDVATFPALAMAGALVRPRRFVPLLVALQIVIVAVGLWEALDPAGYGATMNVAGYYVNTRGLEAAQFREEDLGGLYLNAARPVGRLLLPQTGWLRISSVFLEPVSLGNWTVVVTLFAMTFWGRMSAGSRFVLVASNLVLLVMCDGRLAMLGIAATVLFALAAPVIPRLAVLLLPVATFAGLATVRALGVLPADGDTFSGRLGKGMFYFERLSFDQFMGFDPVVPGYTFDSGWAYFAQTQGLIGFAAFWAALVYLLPWRTPEARRFLIVMALFFTLGLPVSNAFLSIKAAALLFAGYGSLRRWQDVDLAPVAVAPRPVHLTATPLRPRPS